MYVVVLAAMYLGIPLIIAMLINGDFNIYYAFETVNIWLKT